MQDYGLKIAQKLKSELVKNRNSLLFFDGIIKKQEPMIVEALDGEIIFRENENLTLTEDIKRKMLKDPDRKEYIGRRVLVIGLSEMFAFAVI